MKKYIAALMTVLFLGTTGLVLADEAAAPATTPVAKVMKHKKGKKMKKMKKTEAAAASTTPVAK